MKKLVINPNTYTERESESLNRYLNELNNIEMVTREEERELVRKACYESEEEAKEKLIKSNLRFVVSVAKQYNNNSVRLEDLINEGNIGLQNAVERFDPSHEYKFISYAVWWIRKSIMEFLNTDSRPIRFPFNRLHQISKVESKIRELEQKHQREPTTQEIEKELVTYKEIKRKDIDTAMELLNFRTDSIDAPMGTEDDDQRTLGDIIPNDNSEDPEDEMNERDKRDLMGTMLDTLTDEERDIIDFTFGLSSGTPLSLSQTGEEMDGKSREMVRLIRDRALKKLRRRLDNSVEIMDP